MPWPGDKDLRGHAPGQLARQRADEEREDARGRSRLRAYTARLLGVHTGERSWRIGADLEETVGAKPTGGRSRAATSCCTQHPPAPTAPTSTTSSSAPRGVFTVNSKHHPRAKVTVHPRTVYVAGHTKPYLAKARGEAARASRLLTRATGLHVPVTPVLAIRAHSATIRSGRPSDVEIWTRRFGTQLRRRPPLLDPEQLTGIADAVVNAATWRSCPRNCPSAAGRPAPQPLWPLN